MCHRGLRTQLVCEEPYLWPLIVKQAVVLFKIRTIGRGKEREKGKDPRTVFVCNSEVHASCRLRRTNTVRSF